MRKPDLAAEIADKADIPADKANEVLSAILDEITNALSRKESVSLIGFGTFEPRHRNARAGKNPQTGAAMSRCSTMWSLNTSGTFTSARTTDVTVVTTISTAAGNKWKRRMVGFSLLERNRGE